MQPTAAWKPFIGSMCNILWPNT